MLWRQVDSTVNQNACGPARVQSSVALSTFVFICVIRGQSSGHDVHCNCFFGFFAQNTIIRTTRKTRFDTARNTIMRTTRKTKTRTEHANPTRKTRSIPRIVKTPSRRRACRNLYKRYLAHTSRKIDQERILARSHEELVLSHAPRRPTWRHNAMVFIILELLCRLFKRAIQRRLVLVSRTINLTTCWQSYST